jgi:superfamily II DNA or RNA helicase
MQELLPLSSAPQTTTTQAEENSERFQYAPAGASANAVCRFLDAFRLRISHSFDHLSSLSNSRTRLLAHQIEAAHIVTSAVRPRFLIADEVGLGKTIEAGLVIKELMFRRGYENILICVPAPLVVQWQSEMRNRFNEHYTILDRTTFKDFMREKPVKARIIASIDFIKNSRYAEPVLKRKWDLAVFDEAHRLRRDYNKVTVAYSFAESIAQKCEALLLMSATPFRGKLEELYYLVRLIDPHVLGPMTTFMADEAQGRSDTKRRLSQILIRRRKVDVGGFTKRHAQTIRFDLTAEERAFYDETTEYVKREYNLAMQSENRAVGFVMIVFQKLLDSSTAALLRALNNRKMMLERLLGASFDAFESPDEDEWEDSEKPEDLVGRVRDRRSWSEMRKEVMIINRLLLLGRSIGTDRKLVKLKETLEILRSRGHTKFVLFTQFKSTVDYLCEELQGFRTVPFHGSLRMQEKEDAIARFRDSADILISTEAGGEGRNLQFANVLFNYDLPWSPLKVEQRIGRIHRFGQASDVYIFNFTTRDTVAERVLEVLQNKIKLFEDSIGPSDALLGAVQDEGDFQRDVMAFITSKKSKEEVDRELEARLATAKRGYAQLHTLISPSKMNFNWDDYYNFTKKERTITNHLLQVITLSYLREHPASGTLVPQGRDFLLTQGTLARAATFDSERALEKENLEFLALGHPLVEEAVDHYLARGHEKLIYTIQHKQCGLLFVYSVHYSMGALELLPVFVPESNPDRAEILADIPIEGGTTPPSSSIPVDAEELQYLRRAANLAFEKARTEAEKRRVEKEAGMKGAFVSEELKVESSLNKHLRGLRDKQDIQRMRARQNPAFENRASLARTEKEIYRTQTARQIELEKIRRMSHMKAELELLAILRCVKER